MLQGGTDSQSMLQGGTDSQSMLQGGTDSQSMLQGGTDSQSMLQFQSEMVLHPTSLMPFYPTYGHPTETLN